MTHQASVNLDYGTLNQNQSPKGLLNFAPSLAIVNFVIASTIRSLSVRSVKPSKTGLLERNDLIATGIFCIAWSKINKHSKPTKE